MSEAILLVEKKNSGLIVTLNRPQQRNALNSELIEALTDTFQSIADDCRYIVLQGSGHCFCAGADLNWMKETANYSESENLAEAQKLTKLLQLIFNCPTPVIAYAQGHAYGGAIGILAACDTVIAHPDTQFCLSEVKLGLIPATIYPYLLHKMGSSWTTYLSLTATPFKAELAHRYALVHQLGSEKDLDQLVTQINTNAPAACRSGKALLRRLQPIDESQQYLTSEALAQVRSSDEAQEGMQAFFEKRKPNWIHNHD